MPDMQPPCTWPIKYQDDVPCDALSSLSPTDRAIYEQMASAYLWRWTGQTFGVCPAVVRPCRQPGWERYISTFRGRSIYNGSGMPWQPVLVGGEWLQLGCGCSTGACGCVETSRALRLPGVVQDVTEVLVNGLVVDPSSYRVDNHRYLVRTDGLRWPTWQDMDSPPTEDDTFQITYDYGVPVPIGGQVAAGVLACELAKAAAGDKECQLPQRVQTVTRQGVTIALLDSFDDVKSGATGIWIIDSWVASVMFPARRSRVYSVDVPRTRNRRQTWPTS